MCRIGNLVDRKQDRFAGVIIQFEISNCDVPVRFKRSCRILKLNDVISGLGFPPYRSCFHPKTVERAAKLDRSRHKDRLRTYLPKSLEPPRWSGTNWDKQNQWLNSRSLKFAQRQGPYLDCEAGRACTVSYCLSFRESTCFAHGGGTHLVRMTIVYGKQPDRQTMQDSAGCDVIAKRFRDHDFKRNFI